MTTLERPLIKRKKREGGANLERGGGKDAGCFVSVGGEGSRVMVGISRLV